ncbi:MAG TPA: cytochrome c [Acidobacteriaceae bacterium]|nr:cytochrome c [Acidobacteriaceae bacterium]
MAKLKSAMVGLLAAGLALPVAAQDAGQDAGAKVYKSKCSKCHGEDGRSHTFAGRMTGAVDLKDPKVTAMADADLIAVVKNGKKKMPAFQKKLTDDEITAVVAYVRTLEH